MSREELSKRINSLFRRNAWEAARKLLEAERKKKPEDHWVLTQLGVTFYEEKRYRDALELFKKSLAIVNDCPLTLWNLAGALDALGNHSQAKEIYIWLLQAKTSPAARSVLGESGVGRFNQTRRIFPTRGLLPEPWREEGSRNLLSRVPGLLVSRR